MYLFSLQTTIFNKIIVNSQCILEVLVCNDTSMFYSFIHCEKCRFTGKYQMKHCQHRNYKFLASRILTIWN